MDMYRTSASADVTATHKTVRHLTRMVAQGHDYIGTILTPSDLFNNQKKDNQGLRASQPDLKGTPQDSLPRKKLIYMRLYCI
jgi:hypothetical protein